MGNEKIDMTPFCHPGVYPVGSRRDVLSKPFVKGGYLCACDGRICIRIKTDLPETDNPLAPSVHDMFAGCNQTLSAPLDIIEPDSSNRMCGDCLGTGFLAETCKMCDGDGIHQCDCGDDHECRKCYGSGMFKSHSGGSCGGCNGTGKEYKSCEVASLTFDGKYIAKIAKNLTSPKVVAIRSDDDGGVLRFIFDGGEGVLMSLRR